MKFIISILITAACFGQGKQNVVQTGMVDAHGANWIPPAATFASPPSSPATGSEYTFTDASAVGVCTGGGSALAKCRWTGSVWAAIGGAGGSGATSAQQLTNFQVTRTSSTILTVNAVGNVSGLGVNSAFNSTETISAPSGTGSMWAYIDPSNLTTIQILNNVSATCSGVLTCVSGTGPPSPSLCPIILWSWNVTSSGVWDTGNGTDWRSFLSAGCGTGGGGTPDTAVFTGGSIVQRKMQCSTQTIPYTSLTANAASQEINVLTSVNANTRFEQIVLNPTTAFTGGSATGIAVSLGRPGGTDSEMTGGGSGVPIGTGSSPWPFRPAPIFAGSTYTIVANFSVATGTLGNGSTSNFTAGALDISVCAYADR